MVLETLNLFFCIIFQVNHNQTKPIILPVLRQSVKRVDEAHLRVIAPEQHSSFPRNVAAVMSR